MRMRARAAWQSSFHARPPVLSDRDDRSGAAREDGGVAATCIVGAVHCPAGHRDAMSREGGGRSRCRSAHPRGSGRAGLGGLGCRPAGSAGHPYGERGSARSGSFACGTASRSPARASPARLLQQARHHPASLAQWQLEKDLDRQAELDGRIAKHRGPSGSTVTRRAPDDILVDPDQQRPPLAQRCVGSGPVRRAIAAGDGLHLPRA
jgi:hypothetical protein